MFKSALIILTGLMMFNPLYAAPSEGEMWQQFQGDKAMKSLDSEFDETKEKVIVKEKVVVKEVPAAAQRASVPSTEHQIALIRETVQAFALSVKAKDMSGLHNHASLKFQQQFTVEQLNKTFESFINQNIDLTILKSLTPVLDQPATMHPEYELIGIIGHYETNPNRVHFKLQYYYEYNTWKLLAISLDIK